MSGWAEAQLLELTGARQLQRGERIQSLWSGYGELYRATLTGAEPAAVVVKHVRPPSAADHPRGWSGATGHRRKLTSYAVEQAWYRTRAVRPGCPRCPRYLGGAARGDERLLVLEDLDAAGFTLRLARPDARELEAALGWLAALHAAFLGDPADELWPTGCYWHLATRPDELAAMPDGPLRRAAPALDAALEGARFRTLVHGDAKLANLCFAADGRVAAVDFQYTGRGPGVRDVAYLLGGALDEAALERDGDRWLERYLAALRAALPAAAPAEAIEAEWRALYPICWADFSRFLAGWAPGHWKQHGYAARMTELGLSALT